MCFESSTIAGAASAPASYYLKRLNEKELTYKPVGMSVPVVCSYSLLKIAGTATDKKWADRKWRIFYFTPLHFQRSKAEVLSNLVSLVLFLHS